MTMTTRKAPAHSIETFAVPVPYFFRPALRRLPATAGRAGERRKFLSTSSSTPANRSTIFTPRVSAIRCRLARVMFIRPFSNAPTCARWRPDRSANSSWVQPCSNRSARIRAPNRRCISSRCNNRSFAVFCVNAYYLYVECHQETNVRLWTGYP